MSQIEEAKKPALTKVLVTNVTQRNGGAGFFLDPGEKYGNKLLGPGRSMYFDCVGGHMPDFISHWGDAITVHDATSGDVLVGPASGELTPKAVSPVREMTGTDDDFLDEEPSLDEAQEAFMPHRLTEESTAPIRGDISQMSKPRAKVSLGSRGDETIGASLSPIPGDIPRDLDDSSKYTIKAPRSHAVGAVIGTGGKK
jgi:hypothetical protein